MFDDGRSRAVILVAHCVLNQNSISDGTADRPAMVREIVDLLADHEVGIVQMPCPELLCLGLDRGNPEGAASPVVVENTRIRAALDTGPPPARLARLADDVVHQIAEYSRHGFSILGIVGIDRSPSCGVSTTSRDNREVAGRGLFIAALQERLENLNLRFAMVGIRASHPRAAVAAVRELVNPGRTEPV